MSTAEGEQALLTLNLVVNVIIDGLLCVLGYVGNVLTIIVLSKDKVYNSNIFLMQMLAGYDIFFLTHTLLYTVLRSVYPTTGLMKGYYDISPYIVAFDLPFGWIAQTGTIWFTTALAVDRYIGITRPFKALTICTLQNAKRATIVLSVVALLFNFPRFFYYFNVAVHSRNNATFVAHVQMELPGFDANIYRYVYHITLTFIFLYIIPLTALSVLNYKLIKTLQTAGKARKRMSMSRGAGSPSKQNLTITFNLVIVISKFILCETPDFISSIVGAIPDASDKTGYKMFNTVKEMLLVFNSAVNFYIYCLFNAKFRENLRRTLPCCPGRDPNLDRNLSTSTSTLNVSLSSLSLAITAFKGNRRTRTTSAGQPSTANDLAPRLRFRRYKSYSESSGEILEEGEEVGVHRDRLYSAESNDTVLTGVSSEMDISMINDYTQSVNKDYVVFKPDGGVPYNQHPQELGAGSTEKGPSSVCHVHVGNEGWCQYKHQELHHEDCFQSENEDYVIFRQNSEHLQIRRVDSDCTPCSSSVSNAEHCSISSHNSSRPWLDGTNNGGIYTKTDNGDLYTQSGLQSDYTDYKVLKLQHSEQCSSGVPLCSHPTDGDHRDMGREGTTSIDNDSPSDEVVLDSFQQSYNPDFVIFTPKVSNYLQNKFIWAPRRVKHGQQDLGKTWNGSVNVQFSDAPQHEDETNSMTTTDVVSQTVLEDTSRAGDTLSVCAVVKDCPTSRYTSDGHETSVLSTPDEASEPVLEDKNKHDTGHTGAANRGSQGETGEGLYPLQTYCEENVTFV